ncbi:TM2 domain-containing protein [Streptococcus sp. X13SY08]|uniref:TM2 domain-containing protein n=1 Tax=Streptococcus sp. X13SY08 TaxID=1676616 RepID=UPI001F3FF355|nr:TM2 domain-containing protein [Streptococcus sp. X13SY08]
MGEFGADRFYIGNKELGFGKLALFIVSFVTLFIIIGFILFPILFIWKIIDCILIMGACRQANFERLMLNLNIQKAQAAATTPVSSVSPALTKDVNDSQENQVLQREGVVLAAQEQVDIETEKEVPVMEEKVSETQEILEAEQQEFTAEETFEVADVETVEVAQSLEEQPETEIELEDLVSQEELNHSIPVQEKEN